MPGHFGGSPSHGDNKNRNTNRERGIQRNRLRPLVFFEKFENDTENYKEKPPLENSKLLNNYLKENYS